MLDTLLSQVEALPIAAAIRRSIWAYPILEVVHLCGIGALFGSLLTLDMRVLGMQRIVMLQGLARIALRVTLAGFAVALSSGALLFASRTTEIGTNPAFLAKLALIALAGVNAMLFHRRQSLARDDGWAKLQALLSALLWVGAIFAGRLIAYV